MIYSSYPQYHWLLPYQPFHLLMVRSLRVNPGTLIDDPIALVSPWSTSNSHLVKMWIYFCSWFLESRKIKWFDSDLTEWAANPCCHCMATSLYKFNFMSNDKEVPKRLRLVLCEFNKSSQVGGTDNWGVTMAMIDADYEKRTTVGS